MNFYFFIIAVFFLILIPSSESFSLEPSEPVNLSNTPGASYRSQILVNDNEVFMVWTDKSLGISEIFFGKSTDGGQSFSVPINLSNNERASGFPRLTASGDNVYVTWYDYSAGDSDIFLARSADRGLSFEITNLSNNPGGSYNQWIAASGNNVFLVWNDDSYPADLGFELRDEVPSHKLFGNFEIEFAISKDRGETFDIINLSESPGYSINPRIRLFEDNIFIVWNDDSDGATDIFFSASHNNGTTFSKPINLSHSKNTSEDAGLISTGNQVYVVWKEINSETTDIFFTKSNDFGFSFSEPINISNSEKRSLIARDNQMVVIENKIFVVWYENGPGGNAFLAYSKDAGNTFENPVNLSQSSGSVEYTQIVQTKNGLGIVWNDDSSGNWDVFFIESTDDGMSFGSPKNLSHDIFDSRIFILGPQIATYSDVFYTVWENQTGETSDLVLFTDVLKETSTDTTLLQTQNELVDIQINRDNQEILSGQEVTYSLKFLNHSSGELLTDVNYSFSVYDSSQEKIIDIPSQYTKDGISEQSLVFPTTGPFTIIIKIEGLGTSKPFDADFSGQASSVFMVVPEFPLGSIGILILIITSFVVISRISLGKKWIAPI